MTRPPTPTPYPPPSFDRRRTRVRTRANACALDSPRTLYGNEAARFPTVDERTLHRYDCRSGRSHHTRRCQRRRTMFVRNAFRNVLVTGKLNYLPIRFYFIFTYHPPPQTFVIWKHNAVYRYVCHRCARSGLSFFFFFSVYRLSKDRLPQLYIIIVVLNSIFYRLWKP